MPGVTERQGHKLSSVPVEHNLLALAVLPQAALNQLRFFHNLDNMKAVHTEAEPPYRENAAWKIAITFLFLVIFRVKKPQ